MAVAAAKASMPDAPVDDVLTILAIAPSGAWMPLHLVTAVLAERNEDTDHVQVRDILVTLGELVSRADPGTDLERVGPAHDLIAEHLAAMVGPDQLAEAHGRVADAISAAQADTAAPGLAGYARQRLSDHLWKAGRHTEAINALPDLDTPADALSLWQLWAQRALGLGPEHRAALTARSNVAIWAMAAGDLALALAESTALLTDLTRVLGPDHRQTLGTRLIIATANGQSGNTRQALDQLNALLPDLTQALGPDDTVTLTTRGNITTMTAQSGDAREALEQLNALLPDLTRVLGPTTGLPSGHGATSRR